LEYASRMVTSRTRNLALIALAIGGVLPSARASAIDAIYVFGDSLSDVGNVYAASGGVIPGAPYVNGQFSNGPVWVQDLASSLGLAPLSASLVGGTDYAYGGAETGTTPVHTGNSSDLTGPTGQVAQFQAANPTADPNALYTIWIGSNDLLDILTGALPSQYGADIAAAVANVDSAIGSLAGDGAKNFLILTVPDLGATPDAIAGGPVVQFGASALAAQFDSALMSSVDAIASLDSLNLSTLDTYALLDEIVANPSSYGFTNVTSPCVTGAIDYVGGTACASTLAAQNQYLFWDDLHPTAAGHAIVADAALAVLTPEPTYVSLVALGLLGMGLVFHRAGIKGTSRYFSYVSKKSE
jgi:phospholipase/lecithinase/hemolysin